MSGEDCSTKVIAGVPMFPPTSVLRPPEAMISPVSVVVVVLPLEPVMATILPCEEARRQLDFADDRNAEAARVLQRADVAGDSGADHNQILIAEGALAVLAGFHRNAAVEQRRNFSRELILALGIADGDARAARLQKERRGHARLAQSNHQNPFAFDIHKFFPAFEQLAFLTYRNFSVVRANKAKISEPIQNRTITFDSDQPSCSK